MRHSDIPAGRGSMAQPATADMIAKLIRALIAVTVSTSQLTSASRLRRKSTRSGWPGTKPRHNRDRRVLSPWEIGDELRDLTEGACVGSVFVVAEGDETSELIRKMNDLLRGDSDQASEYRAVEPQVSRLWQLFDEERAHSFPARLRARIDAGMHDAIARERLNALIGTRLISHGVSVSRTAASMQEAGCSSKVTPTR